MNTSQLQTIKQRYNIVGNCDALNRALDVALQVAPTDLSVLIVGESGVGKEIIPRLIHDNSPRKREKYFAINCGSIPEGTIDSELFGHEKGSFTGAVGESEGYFGTANKGTIFLDEVGELPLATQARLLRVLETGEYIRVGGQKIMKTDVRIVAATNVNMRKAVSEGRFREDLYYRLNTIPIQMPPLRQRGEDILLLFRLFTMQMAEKYRIPRITLTDDAKQIMLKYKWPGNVRQLKNITEQMSVLCTKREIDAKDLMQFIPQDPESTELATVATPGAHSYESEREILYKILYELRGNVSDLRREMATMRKQMDDTRNMNNAISRYPEHISAYPNDGGKVPAGNALRPMGMHHGPNMPIDIEAEEVGYGEPVNIQPQRRSTDFGDDSDSFVEVNDEKNLNLNDIERLTIEKALERNNGNRKNAATELGISDRTLYRKIKQYGLEK